jgi:hypothetical protein
MGDPSTTTEVQESTVTCLLLLSLDERRNLFCWSNNEIAGGLCA